MNQTTLIGGPLDGAVVAVPDHHPETVFVTEANCKRHGFPVYTDPYYRHPNGGYYDYGHPIWSANAGGNCFES